MSRMKAGGFEQASYFGLSWLFRQRHINKNLIDFGNSVLFQIF